MFNQVGTAPQAIFQGTHFIYLLVCNLFSIIMFLVDSVLNEREKILSELK